MSDKWMRFGVSDGQLAWAATWKLWATRCGETAEVNLASRFLGGRLTAVRGPSGDWRVAFVPSDRPAGVDSVGQERLALECVERHDPPRIAAGCVLAFRILTPAESVTLPHMAGRFRYISWIPAAQPAKAVETTVLITESQYGAPGWRARDLYGRALLGSLMMDPARRVSVFYRTVDAAIEADVPDARSLIHVTDAPDGRCLTVSREPDGAMVVHDRAVVERPA